MDCATKIHSIIADYNTKVVIRVRRRANSDGASLGAFLQNTYKHIFVRETLKQKTSIGFETCFV